jgi:hypothetical protein
MRSITGGWKQAGHPSPSDAPYGSGGLSTYPRYVLADARPANSRISLGPIY